MSAAPAFQFYPNDFLAGTTFLSAAAVGSYMRMLSNSWNHGPIPNTPDALYKAMGLAPTDPPFATVWAELERKWVLTAHGWINRKLEKVRANQAAFSRSQSLKGQLSGRARRKNKTEPRFNPGSTQQRTQHEPKTNSLISISDLDLGSQSQGDKSVPAPIRKPSRDGLVGRHQTTCDPSTWAACEAGKCVPRLIANEWRRQCEGAGMDADAEIKATVTQGLSTAPPLLGDPMRFWRGVWSSRNPTPVSIAPNTTKTGRSLQAAKAAMARAK